MTAGKEPCSLAKGKDSLRTRGEDSVQQRPFLEKQRAESRGNRTGDVEIGAIGKQSIRIGYPLIDLNLGADRTEAAFACSGDVCNLIGMVALKELFLNKMPLLGNSNWWLYQELN